jgi:multiple sugar transport system permease protein
VALLITVTFLFPLLWAFSASFQTTRQLYDLRPHVFPPTPTLVNYRAAVASQLAPLGTSVLVGVLATIACLLIAVPAAYALSTFRWRWAGLLVLALLVAQMVPAVMVTTPLYLFFNHLGLLNSVTGLVIADSAAGVPFAILVLRAFLADIPIEMREAALVDGASEVRTLLLVILPVARTGVIAVAVFCFLFAWGDFLNAVTLNTNGTLKPLSLSLYNFFGTYRVDWGAVMATAVLALLPGALLLVGAQKYIAAGLTAGGVKE